MFVISRSSQTEGEKIANTQKAIYVHSHSYVASENVQIQRRINDKVAFLIVFMKEKTSESGSGRRFRREKELKSV